MLSRASGGDQFRDGAEMHRTIGAELWCVTKLDLIRLRLEVRQALQEGLILPTDRDTFDPADFTHGPTLYTVNEQFIKPTTASAGNMSWALMRNPKGLKCDLFITHAWQEGIFELLDKIISSWPAGVSHAWCCMLANPQNLDISDLIKNPRTSPFAKALESAKYMLVVPNRHESIYNRLWCSYEAFLAYEWNKVIFTASMPAWPGFLKALPLVLCCAALGFGLGMLWSPHAVNLVSELLTFSLYPLVLMVVLASNARIHHACDLLGSFLAAHYAGLLLHFWESSHLFGCEGAGLTAWETWRSSVLVYACSMTAFFIFSEYDRVQHAICAQEADNLRYEGSVIDARCTDPNDALHIRAEIGSRDRDVNSAIRTLLRAGMSSHELRQAVNAGVDVKQFSDVNVAFMVLTCIRVANTTILSHKGGVLPGLQVVYIAFVCIILAIFFFSRLDGRAFCALAMARVSLALDWPSYMIAQALWRADVVEVPVMLQIQVTAAIVTLACVAVPSTLGIHRVARIPICGRFIAQLLVSRGFRQLCRPQKGTVEQNDAKIPRPQQVGQPLPVDLEANIDDML
eukprot:CAMPEP_0115603064 /NCGR_PEP_ID=MMETSP0272-20121206/16230_1 /TAXON_ID=71861 /ORGANISM="Scrippsiella trochoidea, Strain CCMP3099" /LENGTH=570 /DNA_ID=CAMNT_0003038565 /DNA_START=48 /DNA_END=1760 /DNA_ORIENTATION=-